MSKRRIERRIEELEQTTDDGGQILIVCEHDDGTITDPDGEPIPDEAWENAGIVIEYVSWDVVQTWPNVDDGDSGAI